MSKKRRVGKQTKVKTKTNPKSQQPGKLLDPELASRKVRALEKFLSGFPRR
jgi:hypothetical protein